MAYLDIIKETEGRHSNPLNLLIELDKDYPVLVDGLESCTFSKKSDIQPAAGTAVSILLNAPELNIRTISLRTTPEGYEILDFTRNGQIWNEDTTAQLRTALIEALHATNGGILDTAAMYAYQDTIPQYEALGELEQLVVKHAISPAVISGKVGDKIRNDHGSVAIKNMEIDPDGAVYVDLVSEGQCKGCSFAVMGTFNFAAQLLSDRLNVMNPQLREQRADLNAPELYLPIGGIRVFEGWEADVESFSLPERKGAAKLELP